MDTPKDSRAEGGVEQDSAVSHVPWWHIFDRNIPPVPEERQISPESVAGFLSKLTFSWMGRLMAVSRLLVLIFGFRSDHQFASTDWLSPATSTQRHSVT